MKKIFTLFSLSLFSIASIAQVTFFDDFEGYDVGDYIGEESDTWTTWSGATGGSEDVAVTDETAYSGSNSIYFSSTAANGGPQDVVLPFGQAYDDGLFTLSSQMNIANGKNGYLNIQGNTTIGQIWTLDLNAEGGNLVLSEGGVLLVETSYPEGEWFKWEIIANITFNSWQLFIDDELAGTFTSDYNQVASVDIFPIQNSSFWIDDVSFSWEEFPFPDFNATVLGITGLNPLAGIESNPIVNIRNNGLETINSFDIELVYEGGSISTSLSGLDIETSEVYAVDMDETFELDGGEQVLSATISNVNGGDEDDMPEDDTFSNTINIISPAPGKRVVAEEGTGTWCGWCPRGMVVMEHMEETYGDYFIGIAVHNDDPMAFAEYDGPLPILGYPGGLVDRVSEVDPLAFEQEFLDRISVDPVALLSFEGEYNMITRVLDVELSAEFVESVSGNYRLALVLIENGVTGTSGYAQVNYYANGTNGEMGGYESLPNPVPASQMVYNDVARAILPTYQGGGDDLPEDMASGETYTMNFQMTLSEDWYQSNMRIVGFLINPNGRINNAFDAPLDEAVTLGLDELNESDAEISLYPNPSQDQSFIDINVKNSDEVSLRISSANGKLIAERSYGQLSGSYRLPVNTSTYSPGIYFVQVRVGNKFKVEKLIVQ